MKKCGGKLAVILGVWSLLVVSSIVLPAKKKSFSERRVLKQFPQVTTQSLASGGFMQSFEEYALDQFPFRDSFRTLNSVSALYVFRQKDNQGFYFADGYIGKLDERVNYNSLTNAMEKFQYIQETYLKDNNVYFSIVPDKGYFLAEENGYPRMDYDALVNTMIEGMPYAEYIDIIKELEISSYYRTDTHWRQEKLLDVAEVLGKKMGAFDKKNAVYEKKIGTKEFYGVYYGQLALPVKAEPLYYLTNDVLDRCYTVLEDLKAESKGSVYDLNKLDGNDPYEMFLSGSVPILTLVNPENDKGRELILFRDSFGSSIAPLLAEGYSKITLIDIRYVSSQMLEELVEFEGKDVLFLYSTLLLNSSFTFK